MTSLQKVQAIHDKALAALNAPVDGYPGLKRGAATVMLTRAHLAALAVVLRQAAKAKP